MAISPALEKLYTKFGRTYNKGSVIFWEDELGDEMFIILSGKVRISKKIDKKREQTLAVLSDGDFFGEMSLLEGKPRSATAVCLSNTRLIVLNKQNFQIIIDREPRFAYNMLITLSERLRTLNKLLEEREVIEEVKVKKEEVEPQVEIKREEVIGEEVEKEEIEMKEEEAPPASKYLEDIAGGFILSKLLFTALNLDIISYLDLNPSEITAIVDKLNSNKYASELFLNTLVNLNILKKEDSKYSLSTLSNEFLLQEKTSYMGNFINFIADTSNKWQNLEEVIKEGKTKDINENFLREFIKNKNIDVGPLINKITTICDLSKCKRLLEVGNNPAVYACQIASIVDKLNATILDCEKNIEIIDDYITQFELTERVVAQIGDYKEASFGKNQDIIVLSFIMHEELNKNIEFIEKAYDALNNNGYLIIHDYILQENKLKPPQAVLFGLNLLLNQNAKVYSFDEIKPFLTNAGFNILKEDILTDNTAYIVAQKSGKVK